VLVRSLRLPRRHAPVRSFSSRYYSFASTFPARDLSRSPLVRLASCPTLARSSPVFSTLFRTLVLASRWRSCFWVGVQLHPAFVASLHGLPRPVHFVFLFSVLVICAPPKGVRASHDARWLKVWPLHRHRAELGLPVARSLSPVGSVSVDSCASSCFRPRHAGARRVLLTLTGNSYGVSRRSRQPCAPFAVRIAGFVPGTSLVPDHALACGLPSSHVATEEAVTSSSVSPMVDGVRLLFAFFFPS